MNPKTLGYLVLKMQKTLTTNAMPVSLETESTYGGCLIYKSKKLAQKVWGKDIQTVEVEIETKDD